jgi:biotin operon repressor
LEGAKATAKKHGKTTAGIGGVAGGAALAKASSVNLDALAEQRAVEMLKEAGYKVDEQSDEEKLAAAIDQRALEMLKAAGYEVEEAATEPTDEEKLAAAVEQRALEMLKEAGYEVE